MKRVLLNLRLNPTIAALFSVAMLALGLQCAYAAGTGVKIQTFPGHSRVYIPLDPSVDTQLKPEAKGFELIIKGISLSDLGAPLGDEAAWEAGFSKTSDPRLQRLQFADIPGGVRIQGTWKFPRGKLALANPRMETFDFRQNGDQGTGYVLDFWLKKGSMTLAEYKVHQAEQERIAKLRKEEQQRQKLAERRLASEKRMTEIEDTTRFCEQPLSVSNDIFLQFYPIHKKVDFKRWFPSTTPDEYTTYPDPSATDHSDDARYVRLALDLYRQGKVALVLRTLDFLDNAHPHSEYRDWMRFLRANSLIKLGFHKKAEGILKDLLIDAQDSPVSLHSAMYLAELQMERKQTLASAETFMWLIAHFSKYEHVWLFHLGAAESLYALRQTDRALKEYEWVAEKAPDQASRAEGALRAPDLYLERFQYAQALAGYYQAIHYFPEQAKSFPSVYLNRAESLYGLGEYDRAKEAFMAFLKDYAIHPAGWRATYRLGEIDGRKADPAAWKTSRQWFYETINRYPFSAGATLARLRLIPCGDHGGFDYTGAERFFEGDVNSYHADAEVDLVPFHALATLAHVRALIAFRKETEAVNLATDELGRPGNVAMHDILRSTLGSVFRKSILDLLAQGKKYDALAFYKQKAALLPRANSPEEADYLLKLSQAASDLGLGDLARQISDAFAKASATRGVAANSAQDLDSILASSEQHYTAAKALWVASGMKQEAAIRAHLGQVREESPYSYEREIILALMDQASRKMDSALSHAVRAQLLMPAGTKAAAAGATGESDSRVLAWIAGLQADAGTSPADWKAALDMYRNLEARIRAARAAHASVPAAYKVDEVAAALGVPPVPTLDSVVLAQGRLLERLGSWGEAASTYARAMQDKIGGDEAVYQYARSLQKSGAPGDEAKAHAVLVGLAGESAPKAGVIAPQAQAPAPQSGAVTNNEFWRNLARQALADESMVPRP